MSDEAVECEAVAKEAQSSSEPQELEAVKPTEFDQVEQLPPQVEPAGGDLTESDRTEFANQQQKDDQNRQSTADVDKVRCTRTFMY